MRRTSGSHNVVSPVRGCGRRAKTTVETARLTCSVTTLLLIARSLRWK